MFARFFSGNCMPYLLLTAFVVNLACYCQMTDARFYYSTDTRFTLINLIILGLSFFNHLFAGNAWLPRIDGLLIFLIYITILFFIKENDSTHYKTANLIFFYLCAYFILRLHRKLLTKEFVFFSVLFLFLAEVIFILFAWNKGYAGSFYNSTLALNYIVLLCAFLFSVPLQGGNVGIIRWTVFIICATLSTFLLARTAILALLIIVAIFWTRGQVNIRLKAFIVFTVMGGAIVFLTALKKESSGGRMDIIERSMTLIDDNILTGTGPGNFQWNYLEKQYEFTSAHATEYDNIKNVDLIEYPFNDFLLLLIETGILGVLLLLILVYHVAKANRQGVFYFLFCFGLVMCFSYPLELYKPVAIFFMFYFYLEIPGLGSINPPRLLLKTGFACSWMICLGLVFFQYKKYITYHRWIAIENSNDKFIAYNSLAKELEFNYHFQYELAAYLFSSGKNPQQAFIISADLSKKMHSYDAALLHGAAACKIGRYYDAEKAFRTANNLIPYMFSAKYYLFKLFIEIRDTTKAVAMADEILHMPMKVPSRAIVELKNEVTNFKNRIQ